MLVILLFCLGMLLIQLLSKPSLFMNLAIADLSTNILVLSLDSMSNIFAS